MFFTDEDTPSPQRLPAVSPTVTSKRLRQLAKDRRREAAAMEPHIRPGDTTEARFARGRVSNLREEANKLEAQAAKLEVQP